MYYPRLAENKSLVIGVLEAGDDLSNFQVGNISRSTGTAARLSATDWTDEGAAWLPTARGSHLETSTIRRLSEKHLLCRYTSLCDHDQCRFCLGSVEMAS